MYDVFDVSFPEFRMMKKFLNRETAIRKLLF